MHRDSKLSAEQIIERLEQGKLFSFNGGIKPPTQKSMSNSQSIGRMPLPEVLYVPVKQHIGNPATLLVVEGEKVLKGQSLTHSHHATDVAVHAPTSGTIQRIGLHPSAHPSGILEQTIEIIPDGKDEWTQLNTFTDYATRPREELIAKLNSAGIAGLGGAGFSTAAKVNSASHVDFLIINGVECEPYISADDRLMREHAWQIRQGVDIAQHAVNPKHIVVAIEDNKPEAIEAMKIAFKNKPACTLVVVPTVYPSGGEKQLIQLITGREVPQSGLPKDINTLMFNVGTCYAIADFIFQGKALVERVVTITGEQVKEPRNTWTLLGTPLSFILEQFNVTLSKRKTNRVIMGGPMMGFAVSSMSTPVVKTTNCLLLPDRDAPIPGQQEIPCIRCGACADACPANLLPQQLYWHSAAKEYKKAESYSLFDCIECGACSYVCPSDIPLVQYYRQAKANIKNQKQEKKKSDHAKDRFEARAERLKRDKIEREERQRKAAEARKTMQSTSQSTTVKKSSPSAAVAAAIARAKAKKQNSET